MAEYIKREAVLNAITVDGFEHFSGCLSSSEVSLIEMMCDTVSEIPAADVAPVVQGRWVTDGLGDGERICSMCKKYAIYTHRYRYEQYLTKYCPNCGARMDGDGNG